MNINKKLDDLQQKLKGETTKKADISISHSKPIEDALEKTENDVERRGGKRRGAGRKPKQSSLISGSIDELTEASVSKGLELVLTDTKTGKTVTINKPKVLVIIQGSRN